jgi:hypothetical protein
MGWQNQAQYSFKILMTNCVIGVQSNSQDSKKCCQAQMQATKKVPSTNASTETKQKGCAG